MPNSDLISRAAAMDAFMSKPPEYYHTSYIVGEINCLPAVDAAPVRHGRWISHPTEPLWDVCSACGTGCKRRENDDGAEIQNCYQYCPWCGARMMDGGDNDEAD